MTVRDMLTAAAKRYRTRHRFLNRLDGQSQGCEAGVCLLIEAHLSYLCDPGCACTVVATFKSTTASVKEVYFRMNYTPRVIF